MILSIRKEKKKSRRDNTLLEAVRKVSFPVIARAIARSNPVNINILVCFATLAMTENRLFAHAPTNAVYTPESPAGTILYLPIVPSLRDLVHSWSLLFRRLKPTVNKVLSLRDIPMQPQLAWKVINIFIP
jgi:hypothetical protein